MNLAGSWALRPWAYRLAEKVGNQAMLLAEHRLFRRETAEAIAPGHGVVAEEAP
jgi:hypothetical protein